MAHTTPLPYAPPPTPKHTHTQHPRSQTHTHTPQVSFSASKTFCDITVDGVTNMNSGAPVKYGHKRGMSTAGYQLV